MCTKGFLFCIFYRAGIFFISARGYTYGVCVLKYVHHANILAVFQWYLPKKLNFSNILYKKTCISPAKNGINDVVIDYDNPERKNFMKIGFIDYYLDEWHANNFPTWIKEYSNGEMEVAYAYAKIDSPKEGGLTTDAWCKEHNIPRVNTIEELVEKSDAIIVLSPDNAEFHEELCQIPLKSGKPVFVDKTFTDTKAAAIRLADLAKAHNTPCYSASSLMFAEEFTSIERGSVQNIVSFSPGVLQIYAVHQIEPIMYLMGQDVDKVIFTGTAEKAAYTLSYPDGRRAHLSHHGWGASHGMIMDFKNGDAKNVMIQSDFGRVSTEDMLNFFKTGKVTIPLEDTIKVMAVIEAVLKAAKTPDTWVPVE